MNIQQIAVALMVIACIAVVNYQSHKPIQLTKDIFIPPSQVLKRIFYREGVIVPKEDKSGVGIKVEENKSISDNPLDLFSKEEIDLLCATIWGEAGNQPHEGKKLVAKVLLNRLDSGKYGEGVHGVVYAKSQFNCIERDNFGYYTEDEKVALAEAIVDTKIPSNLVWFANEKISTNRGFINRVLLPNKYKKVGEHTFSTNPNMDSDEE